MLNTIRHSCTGLLSLLLIALLFAGCTQKERPVLTNPLVGVSFDQYEANADKMAQEGQYKTSNYLFKIAIEGYEKSESWEKALKCYIKLGDNYQKMDDVSTALGSLNRALDLTKNRLGYESLELAKSYQRLAFKFLGKKDFDQALALYQKALSIQVEILGKDHPEVAKTHNSIALVYMNKNQVLDANTSYLNSYSIKMKQLNGVPADIDNKFRSLPNKGESFKKGEFNGVRNRFNQSLDEYQRLYGQNKPLFGIIYEQIGILYALEKDYDLALEYIRKGFDIRIEAYGDQSPEAGSGYLNIGICLLLKGDLEEALKFMKTALSIKTEKLGEFHPETSDTYCQMGKIYFQQDRLDEALDCFQKALLALIPGFKDRNVEANPSLEGVIIKDKLLEILSAKANTLRMQYIVHPERIDTLKNSFATYSLVSKLLEMMRQSYKADYYKLFFGEKNHPLYQQAIQAALMLFDATGDARYKDSAFLLSEKSKAGVLAESMYEASARQFAGIPGNLLDKEKKLREDLTYYDTYLQKEYAREKPDSAKIKNIENQYYSLALNYRQLIDFFEKNYKKYYDLKYKPHNVNSREIQQALDSHTAIIEYFIGENGLNIFVLTGNSLDVVDVTLDDNFNRLVDEYSQAIKKIEEAPFLSASLKLYRLLIKPIRHLINGKTKLIVIPDDVLHTVPFESLTGTIEDSYDLSKIDFMIKSFTFSYHYSAGIWLHNTRNEAKKRELSFIGFAPVFGDENGSGYVLTNDPLRNSPDEQGGALSQLPATEEELRSIINLFKAQGKKAVGYFYREATKDNFKATVMREFNLIHVATHSLKGEDQSQLAGLVFSPSPGKNNDKDDGILYSGEIYNLNLDSDLIVLSSCESGVGKLVKGEGMMALNRGFFYAGIKNIVFSLWRVEDRSACRLMIAFYRNILKDLPFSQALQNAKLELIKDPFTAFPKYWSGFLLVGN